MSPAGDKVLSIPALGRPFRLGNLYDCVNENLIPGITLWDQTTLKGKTIQHLETSKFSIIASDSLEKKSNALDINAEMKLSFLAGLVEVSGSAKYLDNEKSSSKQERVTLHYKCTTKSEEMTMEQLGPGRVEHPEVFDKGTATHVVTGIIYGAQAFFVFERDCSSSSHDKEVHGDLNVMVKNLPKININGSGELDISEHDKKKVKKFTCNFDGDFLLPENPCCYEDAVKVYKKLPHLLGEKGEKAVPVKVTLYPLTLLDNKACKLDRAISADLTIKTENVFEEFHSLTVRCNDLDNTPVVEANNAMQRKISEFKSLITAYKLKLQGDLSELLPGIRGGGTEESRLAELLMKKEASPYSYHNLDTWLKDEEKRVKILNEYIKMFADIKFASQPSDFDSIIMSPENDYVICFRFLLPQDNSQLHKMKLYNTREYDSKSDHTDEGRKPENSLSTKDVPGVDVNDKISIMEKAILFRNFHGSNKRRTGTAFVVEMEFSNMLQFQAHIQCYRYGRLLHENYELPSAPGIPQADSAQSTHKSISIQWKSPDYGASVVQTYEILCQRVNKDSCPVSFTTSAETRRFTIPNLEPSCAYLVSVQSICEAGVGPSSKENTVSTRPTSPPGKPEVYQISRKTIEIRWSEPLCRGSDCSIQSYVVKMLKEETNTWEEIEKTKAEKLFCRTEVTPNSVPRFKIVADCGNDGCSVDSDPSDLFTVNTNNKLTKANNNKISKENLCGKLNPVAGSTPRIYMLHAKLVNDNKEDLIRKYELGTPEHNSQEKVILLVGKTGAGKTTLINSLINYVFGVKWKDEFRFKLISEDTGGCQGKTQYITSYTIHHQKGFSYPNTLTIIDTPGFSDTYRVMIDREFTSLIRTFFKTTGTGGIKTTGTDGIKTTGTGGINHIDALGFVCQSSQSQLTPAQKFIFNQMFSLFGKDIKDNTFLFLSFADLQKPQVLSGIKTADLPYRTYFKFNNSATYANNTDDTRNTDTAYDSDNEHEMLNVDKIFWQMGEESFNVFTKQLNVAQSKYLLQTEDVLKEQDNIAGICTKPSHTKEAVRYHQSNIVTATENLRERYEKTKNHILKIKDEYEEVRQEVMELTLSLRESLASIQGTSLRPVSLTALQHIDTLISKENIQKPLGWKMAVKQLENIRKCTEFLQEIADDTFNPFEDFS